MILNDAPLDGKGVALQYPVILLSCASISLAAEGANSDSRKCDDGERVVPFPVSWWRALNLTDEDMMMAKDALQMLR